MAAIPKYAVQPGKSLENFFCYLKQVQAAAKTAMALGGDASADAVGMGVNYVGGTGDPFAVDLDGDAEPIHRPSLPIPVSCGHVIPTVLHACHPCLNPHSPARQPLDMIIANGSGLNQKNFWAAGKPGN
jgi:hypothetical protein